VVHDDAAHRTDRGATSGRDVYLLNPRPSISADPHAPAPTHAVLRGNCRRAALRHLPHTLLPKMSAREAPQRPVRDARSVLAAKFALQAGREPDGRLDLSAPHRNALDVQSERDAKTSAVGNQLESRRLRLFE